MRSGTMRCTPVSMTLVSYSRRPVARDGGAAQAMDRDYNLYLIQLHELAIGEIMRNGELDCRVL
ncbi:hypothetical protein JB92DRAFT_2975322 [Gautieria morchelliformis]|nr:hypothetical protein JB92DRAFT_2975322 [Gautieria morchelliformis]